MVKNYISWVFLVSFSSFCTNGLISSVRFNYGYPLPKTVDQNEEKQFQIGYIANLFVSGISSCNPGLDIHVKRSETFVLLRGVNHRFWSHSGCSGRNATIFSLQSIFKGALEETIKNSLSFLF